ncbi:polysaccharide deacetylase family protein [Lunatimonas lonarensis]|nr:polysaccharide deacetylase family protein [Lunatimonas lonarensis]
MTAYLTIKRFILFLTTLLLCNCSENDANHSTVKLSFDDNYVMEWAALISLFEEYDAKVTFFVCCIGQMSCEEKEAIVELKNAGHSIQAHGELHVSVNTYMANGTYREYLKDEVDENIQQLAALGITPSHFALPYGEHYKWINLALWRRFNGLRDVVPAKAYQKAIVSAPESYRNRRWIASAELENQNFDRYPWDNIAASLREKPATLYLNTHRPGVEGRYELSKNNIRKLLDWGKREGFRFESL